MALPISAAEPTPAQTEFFENKIRPLFAGKCYKCHSHESAKLKGGLSLEFRDSILKGGESGPALVPGHPETSLLIKAVSYQDENLQMPPKGEKLSANEIADLEAWIKMGAPDPRRATAASAAMEWGKEKREHWSFLPMKKPPVPEVKQKEFVQTPVDAFIVAKLEANDMKPNPLADKRTLIRRVTFDLIGLPPTAREIQDFVDDTTPDAFAKVVDRLLASPHYGERWGRYWLDIARYSDTKGDVKKAKEDPRYPYAWTYRDYVIRSFNEDKPYNKFIIEQLAADRLPTSMDKGALAGLGFLTVGERFNDNQNDIINDRIDVVTRGLMGLTVTCARCHDHKFDPIPTRDYYSLHGVFASSSEPKEGPLLGKITPSADYSDFYKKYSEAKAELAALEKKGKGKGPAAKEVRKDAIRLRTEITELEMTHPGAPARAMVLADDKVPRDSPIFIRGEAENKGAVVPRQFLEILSGKNRTPFRTGSGRLDLAVAIASTNNPMTARALINRVWMHHFGEGFVSTPDDLGNQAEAPSHPELLDYLSARFMEEGWSIKRVHRLILLSRVYQQSTVNNARYAQVDPNNRLLWRANLRRLDFEAVRDSILALGGKLDLTLYGRPVNIGTAPYSTRRTIYGYIDRRNLPEIYNQFDFANPDVSMSKRYETVVPQQSLFLMNSPLVVEQARNLVSQPAFAAETDPEARVKFLYATICQREPSPTEIKLALGFLNSTPVDDKAPLLVAPRRPAQEARNKKREQRLPFTALTAIDRQPLSAWEKYAHALLQSNETLFIN